jgi:hypothetical protein
VTGWKGVRIRGLLANDPFHVPGLRAGAVVDVEEGSVFDDLHRLPDGTQPHSSRKKCSASSSVG